MAARKILPFSTFTIFLTLLLLSSRIYCQDDGDDEDCDEDSSEDSSENDNGPGSGPGPVPGNIGPGKGPGSDTGKGLGSDPLKGLGSDPGKGLGSDPLKGLGSDPLKGLGLDVLKGLGPDLGSLPGIGDIVDGLLAYLDPAYLKSLVDYGGELLGMLTPILTSITDAIGTVLQDPETFVSDPIPVLEKLVKGILGPIAGLTKEVAVLFASTGLGIETQISDALPEPLSGFVQGPIGDIANSVFVIGLNAADAVQGAADLDEGAILKSLGKIGDSVKTLISGLASLPNDLKSAGG